MPIYEYRCANGHDFEVFQSMADDPVEICEICGATVQRVFSPVAVHYKGSGFYSTDYAKKGAKSSSNDGGSSKSESGSDSKSTSDKGSSSSGSSDSKSSGSNSGSSDKSGSGSSSSSD